MIILLGKVTKMLAVSLSLEVGNLVDGEFQFWDSFTIETHGTEEHDCESVNNLLSNPTCDEMNYAQLMFTYSLNNTMHNYLVGSFKRINLKNKGSKWILTD
jgi:hypothetical protein